MKRGEIWLVEFADVKGHEQAGTRPVVLLSDEVVNVCIIIPLTSNISADRFSYTLKIKASKFNGLSIDSVALIFQVRAIDKHRFKKRIGTLEAGAMNKIEKLIKDLIKI